jgi:hypothetical protein
MAQLGRHLKRLYWRGRCGEIVPKCTGIASFESVWNVSEDFHISKFPKLVFVGFVIKN